MVGQHPLPHRHGFCAHGTGENGIGHGIGGKPRQIPGGRIMIGGIQTVGIDEVGVLQSQLPGLVVHQLRKALDGAAAPDGQRRRRIVAAAEHKPVEQLLDGEHLPLLKIHGAALNTNSLGRDLHPVENIAPLTYDQGRHDLRGACNQTPVIGIFFIERPAGSCIQHNSLFRRNSADRTEKKDGGHKDRRRPKKHCFHILTQG